MGSSHDFEGRMRRQYRESRRTSGIVAITAIFVVASMHMLRRERGLRELSFSVLVLWLTYLASIFIHELGHALVARAVGLRPVVLLAGTGPRLRRRVAGTALNVGIVPASGLVLIASEGHRGHMKLRLAAVYAAGPIASLALWWIGYVPLGHHWTAFKAGSDEWVMPGAALVLVNALVLLLSASPFAGKGDNFSPVGDLVQIALLPRLRQMQLDNLVLAGELTEVTELLGLERYAAALEAARHHASKLPCNWVARLEFGTLLLFAREYDSAAREFAAMRNVPALRGEAAPARVGALVANNYAWACYMLEDEALLHEADRASAEAHRELPNVASVLSTRGAVLVALGRVVEGKALLNRALRLHRSRVHRAVDLACLALAAFEQGKHKTARRLLNRAKDMDPDCELLSRAQRAVTTPIRAERRAPSVRNPA